MEESFQYLQEKSETKTKPRYAQRTKILLPLWAILVDMGIFTSTKIKIMHTKIKLFAAIMLSVYSSALLAQDSESASNSDDRNLLTEIYDGTYTVSNEIFEAKLVGVYMADYPELYQGGYNRESTILRNYYNVDQFAVFQQLPTEVYWSVQETDKNNKDWTRENTFTYPGTEAPSWFTFEFLRGKLLTIKTNTTRDYLFSGFSKHKKGKLGTRGMSLNFTSDDEKQFIIETIVGQDDEVYLVLTPSLMTSLGMGNLTTDFEGEIQYLDEDYSEPRWTGVSGNEYYADRIDSRRFFRSTSFWSIIMNKTSRSNSYSKIPTALLFKLELVE